MQSRDPIDTLMSEHEKGLAQLERLNSASQDISTRGFSPEKFLEITEAIRFFSTELRAHNEREESYLFPLVERHADLLPRTMLEERKQLWKILNRLRQSVEDIEEGKIYATTVKEMLNASGELYRAMTSHIVKENEVLFPMARKLLTPAEFEHVRENISPAMNTLEQ